MDLEFEEELDDSAEVGQISQAVGGANLAGVNLAGINLAGTNLAGTNLAGINLAGTNLAGTNLAGSNLAGTNLAGNNLAGTNLAGTNLAGTNLAGTNLAGTNLAGSNLAGSNLAGSNLAGAFPGLGCPVAGTQRLGTNLTLSTVGVNIHNLPSANGMLASGEDVFTRTQACVAAGIGSTALSRLIAQNSGATMYAALKQLPWGFASSSGGPLTQKAWEVVIWGANRYSVFILSAPPEVNYAGVAGFVKAVWRWNAPPTRTLQIGQIGGGQPVASYSGMMNTSALVLNGTITEKAFVAGELAFLAATTNNVSVNLDFASWVRKADNNPIVLGNVSGAPGWAEGVFTTYELGDGSIGLAFESMKNVASPVKDLTQFNAAYGNWTYGLRPVEPMPKRCGAALYLKDWRQSWDEPVYNIPAGKCDPYTVVSSFMSGSSYAADDDPLCGRASARWADSAAVSPKVLPYNTWMRIEPYETTSPTVNYKFRPDPSGLWYPIIAQTYVHLNEATYTPYP